MAQNTARASTHGPTSKPHTKASGAMTRCRAAANSITPTVVNTSGTSRTTCFTATAYTFGLTAPNILASSVTTRNMGKGFTSGVMGKNLRGGGIEGYDKGRVDLYCTMGILRRVFGGRIRG